MSLMYIVKRSGPNIEPWEHPLQCLSYVIYYFLIGQIVVCLTGSCVEVAVKPHLCHNIAVFILKCCALMYQKLLTNQ